MAEPKQDNKDANKVKSSFGFSICPYCNSNTGFDYVHGHYQCKKCKQNVMPCCGGETEELFDS